MDKNECKKIAEKFSTKKEFHDKCRKAYNLSKKMGWYEEITSHMCSKQQERKKEMYIEAKNAALKYKSRKEFFESEDKKYFIWASNNKCITEICSHMPPIGSRYKRCIYCYIFSDKSCYIGLTYDLEQRDLNHKTNKKSNVYKHSIELNENIPIPIQLTEYIDKESASKLEGIFLEEYKNKGYNILNVAKTGGLGGKKNNVLITKEYCKEKANECLTRSEFEKKYKYLYHKVLLKKWDDYVFSHMDSEYANREKSRKISEARKGKKVNYKDLEKIRKIRSYRKIKQYDLNGNFIGEYESCSDASRKVFNDNKHGSGIRASCISNYNSYGFKWKFSDDKKRTYNLDKKFIGNSKGVLQYNLNGIFICEYSSCKEAATKIGHPYSSYNISKCCAGKIKKCLGYIWKYKNNV